MFRAIGVIISWLPTIVATVMSIEQLVSESTSGEEKKGIALKTLYRVLAQAGVAVSQSVKVAISTTIDAVVAILNIFGIGGFRDSDEQETVELLPAAHVREVEVLDVELSTSSVKEDFAKAFDNDERLDELEVELTRE